MRPSAGSDVRFLLASLCSHVWACVLVRESKMRVLVYVHVHSANVGRDVNPSSSVVIWVRLEA